MTFVPQCAGMPEGNQKVSTKGQFISKGHFVFFSILPKTERKISAPVGYGKNLSFQARFLGELETPKRHFEIN